ncbi:MAG: peptidoglycan-associated lipoprotein Pal [Deltaproteobacteria bacterium]|nr:peptidoglycan-associated lipoprotein Pal [Deltaproteobacteria bacterium]MBW2308050.1 peptidoglycan-associated lipoprotein Pal [Deltaproteobacteria bacterium]
MAKRSFRILLYLSLVVLLVFVVSACAKKKVAPPEEVTPTKEVKPEEVVPKKPALTEAELARKRRENEERARKEAMERARMTRERELLNRFLSEHVHFDFDKFIIKDSEKPILERKKQWMMDHPTAKVLIEGHCDERGTNEYNLALGDRRANASKQYLILLGIDADRLSTISYGEEKPIDSGHNEEAWAKNRRAQFIVISQ